MCYVFEKIYIMTKKQAIQLFQERKVRTVWDDEQEKWFFCVVDVVEALTDSVNPTDYIKKMKKRDPELAKGWGQIVTPLSIQTAGGKQKVNCATKEGIFRIIQSIPSPKAEPFKLWMAQVASQRIDQMQDPELSIDQAIIDNLSKQLDPRGFHQQTQVAKDGGSVAKAARNQLESQLGRSVISSAKASDYLLPDDNNED